MRGYGHGDPDLGGKFVLLKGKAYIISETIRDQFGRLGVRVRRLKNSPRSGQGRGRCRDVCTAPVRRDIPVSVGRSFELSTSQQLSALIVHLVDFDGRNMC